MEKCLEHKNNMINTSIADTTFMTKWLYTVHISRNYDEMTV
jgi:hypothetical protein